MCGGGVRARHRMGGDGHGHSKRSGSRGPAGVGAFPGPGPLPVPPVPVPVVAPLAAPRGMGVVEAGMILALTAAGVPENDAVAAVFVAGAGWTTAFDPDLYWHIVLGHSLLHHWWTGPDPIAFTAALSFLAAASAAAAAARAGCLTPP